jgi:hypothetical protein
MVGVCLVRCIGHYPPLSLIYSTGYISPNFPSDHQESTSGEIGNALMDSGMTETIILISLLKKVLGMGYVDLAFCSL